MLWLIWRELVVITRTAGWWMSVAVQTLLLSAFVVIWGDGVPVWTGSVFEQFGVVHFVFLAVALPWVASRCVQDDVRQLRFLALLTAAKPSHVIVARATALTLALVAFVATALPMTLTALRISALGLSELVESLLPTLVLCALVAATVSMVSTLAIGRLMVWLFVSAIIVFVLTMAPRGPANVALLAAAIAILVSIGASRAERTLRYLDVREREP
jgi:hypothetical protein